jgi:predicted Zn finger-like uncharacterized protein
MPIVTECPLCNTSCRIPDELVGRAVRCPSCKGEFDAVTNDGPAPPPPETTDRVQNSRRPPAPSPRDDDDRPRNRPAEGGFRCRKCGSTQSPVRHSQISVGGWVVFAVLVFFCAPLCWIGLLMKEEYRSCFDCGARLG